jgi:choline-sulfatase
MHSVAGLPVALLLGLALLRGAAGVPAAAPPKSDHGILFLFSDEMDGRIHDPASPQTKPPLPNLKRLAQAGALFTTTYSQSPQCVPSRSALMVGLRTDQIEVYDNFVGLAGYTSLHTHIQPLAVSRRTGGVKCGALKAKHTA